MTVADWLMIVAVITGPALAVQVSKIIEAQKETRKRKIWVFETLMATRASRLSFQHVRALNQIDLAFSKSDRGVLDAWKEYNDHLNNHPGNESDQWNQRADELFVEMLYNMAKALGYKFDKVHIKRQFYYPRDHGDLEAIQRGTALLLAEILAGNKPLSMEIVKLPGTPEQHETQQKLNEGLAKIILGDETLKVRIVNEENET